MSTPLLTRLRDEFGAVRAALPANVIAAAARQEALERLCALGLPATREENWRYANLRVLERARFTPAPPEAATPPLPEPLSGFSRYV
ncbi:MAG: hypothetical protein ACYCT1_16930, partial [Steroidobacteraceae bacterium]